MDRRLCAGFAELRLAGVYGSAAWFVIKIWFVVPESSERFSLRCNVYSATELQSLRNVFVDSAVSVDFWYSSCNAFIYEGLVVFAIEIVLRLKHQRFMKRI